MVCCAIRLCPGKASWAHSHMFHQHDVKLECLSRWCFMKESHALWSPAKCGESQAYLDFTWSKDTPIEMSLDPSNSLLISRGFYLEMAFWTIRPQFPVTASSKLFNTSVKLWPHAIFWKRDGAMTECVEWPEPYSCHPTISSGGLLPLFPSVLPQVICSKDQIQIHVPEQQNKTAATEDLQREQRARWKRRMKKRGSLESWPEVSFFLGLRLVLSRLSILGWHLVSPCTSVWSDLPLPDFYPLHFSLAAESDTAHVPPFITPSTLCSWIPFSASSIWGHRLTESCDAA